MAVLKDHFSFASMHKIDSSFSPKTPCEKNLATVKVEHFYWTVKYRLKTPKIRVDVLPSLSLTLCCYSFWRFSCSSLLFGHLKSIDECTLTDWSNTHFKKNGGIITFGRPPTRFWADEIFGSKILGSENWFGLRLVCFKKNHLKNAIFVDSQKTGDTDCANYRDAKDF